MNMKKIILLNILLLLVVFLAGYSLRQATRTKPIKSVPATQQQNQSTITAVQMTKLSCKELEESRNILKLDQSCQTDSDCESTFSSGGCGSCINMHESKEKILKFGEISELINNKECYGPKINFECQNFDCQCISNRCDKKIKPVAQ